jgi:hypothetical protein
MRQQEACMHPNRTRRHSLLTAKSFTIAMVLVNAAGLVLVQQKMKGAQVDDAYALDDGAQRVASIRPAEIHERRLLAEIELSAAPPSRPYVELPVLQQLPAPRIDLELADLEPPAVPARVRHASRAAGPSLAVAEPAPIARLWPNLRSGLSVSTGFRHRSLPGLRRRRGRS